MEKFSAKDKDLMSDTGGFERRNDSVRPDRSDLSVRYRKRDIKKKDRADYEDTLFDPDLKKNANIGGDVVMDVNKMAMRIASNFDFPEVGDIWAGTWGYSMRLATFAKVVGVTGKSVVFEILGNRVVGGDSWRPLVMPNERDIEKRVTVRWKNGSYLKVGHAYLSPWDGNPLQEDHLD